MIEYSGFIIVGIFAVIAALAALGAPKGKSYKKK